MMFSGDLPVAEMHKAFGFWSAFDFFSPMCSHVHVAVLLKAVLDLAACNGLSCKVKNMFSLTSQTKLQIACLTGQLGPVPGHVLHHSAMDVQGADLLYTHHYFF